MNISDIHKIQYFVLKNDEEANELYGTFIDEDYRIFKVEKILDEAQIVVAYRYYEMDPLEEEFPFSYFLQDKIEIYDATIIEEREKKAKEAWNKEIQRMEEEKRKQDESKKAHFIELHSPFQRGQEIELLKGYPKKALDFSTKEDRYYLDDCKLDENDQLVYSLMTVGTRKHRENIIYTFYTTFSFYDFHFKMIEGSFYAPKKSKYESEMDWK